MAKDTPELVAAAEAIEAEQQRLEELAADLHKTKLHSEKAIGRAARDLQAALEQQEKLAQSLRALGEVMVRMQDRQQAAVTKLGERAVELQARRERLSELMLAYAALGSKAAELLTTMSSSLEGSGKQAAVTAADAKLAAIVADATALATTARGEDFPELARESDVLKQKFDAVRAQLVAAAKTNTN